MSANRIDEALARFREVNEDTTLTSSLIWSVAILILFGAIVAVTFLLLRKHEKFRNNGALVRSSSIVSILAVLSTMIFGMSSMTAHRTETKNALEDVSNSYKEAIVDGYNLTDEDLKNAQFRLGDDGTGPHPEVNFKYTDKDEMTRYELIFIFDDETHEPILLKSGNVTEQLVEKLAK